MGRDVSSYRREYNQMDDNITSQKAINARIRSEIERLEIAKLKLEGFRDFNAKEIVRDSTSKHCGSNLRWRGKRKKDYDDFVDHEVKKKAEAFEKAINGIVKEVKYALKRKKGELSNGEKTLKRYEKKKNNALNQINKLSRKEQGGGGFR